MYYVTKTYGHDLGLSACFRQWRAKSHCRFLHGYPLSFKLTFAADKLDKNNWVLDFGGLKAVKQWLVETFDHRLLVAEDDPARAFLLALGDDVPVYVVDRDWHAHPQLAQPILVPFVGCEGFAEYVARWVNTWLVNEHYRAIWSPQQDPEQGRGLRLVSVEVREHGGNSAIYEVPDNG